VLVAAAPSALLAAFRRTVIGPPHSRQLFPSTRLSAPIGVVLVGAETRIRRRAVIERESRRLLRQEPGGSKRARSGAAGRSRLDGNGVPGIGTSDGHEAFDRIWLFGLFPHGSRIERFVGMHGLPEPASSCRWNPTRL